MELKALKALTAAAMLAATTAATAGTAPFNMVSGPTTPGVDVSLTIQESSMPGYDYDFVISNSSLMGIVTGVYFEVDWNSMLGGASSSGPATLLPGTHTPQIAGWEGTKSSHTVEQKRVRKLSGRHYVDYQYDNLDHGVQEGDVQIFSFNAHSDILSLEDLESMLGTDGYGVAIKMQGLTQDEQASGWGLAEEREEELLVVQRLAVQQDGPTEEVEVTAAPTPTAALAGLVVAGIAGLRRRRK
ncbi:MAG: hypothetical protein KTR15_15665 [Phycisphaeraceae bacterium]|nr:hypothetical protein [Phycisphaeraceae bacterium]